jgi:serine/threonine protein kinase
LAKGWEAFRARLAGNYGRAADLYLDAGKYKKALGMYIRAGLLDQAARLAMRIGDNAYAVQLFVKDRNFRAAGDLYAKMGRFSQAVECYMQSTELGRAARLLEKNGQFERAAAIWIQARRKDLAAAALVKGNFPDQAVPLLEELLEQMTRDVVSIDDYGEQIRKYAGYCGRYYRDKGRPFQAATCFERAGMKEEAARAHAQAGNPQRAVRIYCDLREWEKAAELIGTFPAPPAEAEAYGDALLQAGEYERAGQMFEEGGVPFRAADCYEEVGEYERAARIYLQKNDSLRAAELFAQADDFEKAAALFVKGENFSHAAECFERLDKKEEAADAYLRGKKPLEAAKLYLAIQSERKAIEALQSVPPESPGYQDAAFYLAQLFTKTGRFELALEKFKEAIGRNPLAADTVDKYYRLAICLEEMKKFAKAREIYNRILSIQYGYADVEARLEALGKKEVELPVPEETLSLSRKQVSLTFSGRYEITDAVGESCYKGWDSSLGRVVAIRRYDMAEVVQQWPGYEDRLREVAALSHPNIVSLYDTAAQEDSLYLFHEYTSGTSLRQILDTRKSLPPATVMVIGTQIGRALEYAHSKDVIHGALRPECIIISGENEVKVSEFALSAVPDAYEPPEAARGRPLSKESDLYQFALVLHEMLAGKLPEEGKQSLPAVLSTLLCELIGKALAPRPEARPRTAQEFLRIFSEAGIMPGVVISSRYEILEELGTGGMGKVYKALDRELGEEIALKSLHSDLIRDTEARERFLREIKLLRKITHPNVVRVHDIGRWEDHEFLTMEYLDAKDLFDHVKHRGPFAVSAGVHLATQICDGLEQAHRHKIVHRDLKPQNIVVTADGTPKILDFGIARAGGEGKDITATGQLIGSPKYMSPEQILGKAMDVRSDLYSLGIVFYYMFSGREPFDGETVEAVVMKQVEKMPPPLASFVPQFPAWLDEVIAKTLRKNPAERYASAASLRAAFEEGMKRQEEQPAVR